MSPIDRVTTNSRDFTGLATQVPVIHPQLTPEGRSRLLQSAREQLASLESDWTKQCVVPTTPFASKPLLFKALQALGIGAFIILPMADRSKETFFNVLPIGYFVGVGVLTGFMLYRQHSAITKQHFVLQQQLTSSEHCLHLQSQIRDVRDTISELEADSPISQSMLALPEEAGTRTMPLSTQDNPHGHATIILPHLNTSNLIHNHPIAAACVGVASVAAVGAAIYFTAGAAAPLLIAL